MSIPGSLKFELAPGAKLEVDHLKLLGSATLVLAPGSHRAQSLETIEIDPNAKLDLADNILITKTTPAGSFDGVAYGGVQGLVQRAYNFGAWDQPGLTTSMPLAGPSAGALSNTTTIAVATAGQVLFIGPSDTGVFAGHTVTGASTIAAYTYAGDMNLDGLVDGADYGLIDNYVQFPGTDGYANGDLNYDGTIDGADYGIIDNTIQLQGAPIPLNAFANGASVTPIPEPAAASVFTLLGALAIGTRVRRRVAGSSSRC
jgi:hypothetical protein